MKNWTKSEKMRNEAGNEIWSISKYEAQNERSKIKNQEGSPEAITTNSSIFNYTLHKKHSYQKRTNKLQKN